MDGGEHDGQEIDQHQKGGMHFAGVLGVDRAIVWSGAFHSGPWTIRSSGGSLRAGLALVDWLAHNDAFVRLFRQSKLEGIP